MDIVCLCSVRVETFGVFFKGYNIRTCEPLEFQAGTARPTERHSFILSSFITGNVTIWEKRALDRRTRMKTSTSLLVWVYSACVVVLEM